jgi:putative transport protein
MLVVTLGFVIGRIRIRGVEVGPAGGTLVVALAFGAAGLTLEKLYGDSVPPVTIGLFGFSLFIYAIGFEAGPRFFRGLSGGAGWRFMIVALGINALAAVITVALARWLALDGSTAAGILAGSLTSAPAYAAASELAPNPAHLAVSFALAFPVGLLAIVLVIQILPRVLRDPIAGGRASTEAQEMRAAKGSPELTRVFEVTRAEAAGPTLGELNLTRRTGCVIRRIRRGDEFESPDADTRLQLGDHVLATGRVDELHLFEEVIGHEVYDGRLGRNLPDRRIIVASRAAIGRSLSELDLIRRHKVVIASIERGNILLEPDADEVLERDDVVIATGAPERLEAASQELGFFEPPPTHTNIAMYAGGICLGLLIGNVHLEWFGLDISLGLAGGLLLVGVILGRFRRMGQLSANVPAPARQLVRDLGILLFVGETGIEAGHLLGVTGVDIPIDTAIAVSMAAVLVPLVLVFAVARWVLRMSAVDTWGSLAGGMTSTAALVTVKKATQSNDAAASYAATFAIASVLATIAGQAVVRLL